MSKPYEYDEEIEHLDGLLDVCEARNCLEENFGVSEEESRAVLVKWAKELISRYDK